MSGNKPGFLRLLWEVQAGLCSLCGQPIVWRDPKVQRMTRSSPSIDHVLPRAIARQNRAWWFNSIGNLTCAHSRCNSERGAKLPTGCSLIWADAVSARLGKSPEKHARVRRLVKRLRERRAHIPLNTAPLAA